MSDTAPKPDLERCRDVARELRRVMRGIDMCRHTVADRFQLTVSEMITLTELHVYGPLRAGDLAERVGLTTGSVTALLDRLQARGLLARSRPPSDRRVVWVAATPAGMRIADGLAELLAETIGQVVRREGMPPADQLTRCFGELGTALHELAASPAAFGPAGGEQG